jgi:orotidine-5'-phosphate decarboxylase
MKGKDRIIFALDVDSPYHALQWVKKLSGSVGAFKVGLELFVAAGPELVGRMAERGEKVFLDLKFHDIPATVAGAVRTASSLGAFMINVHALAGSEALKRASEAVREGAAKAGKVPPKLLAVTVLTSHSQGTLDELGVRGTPAEAVERFALLAKDSGADGVVASPLEAGAIRNLWSGGLIVTPGVRPAGASLDDQSRIATPAGAVLAGADYLVIGRPIKSAADPRKAAEAIALEIDGISA